MGRIIEFDDPEWLAAGAVGEPGARTFLVQAEDEDGDRVTVLVEKQQVATLADELQGFLARLAEEVPPQPDEMLVPTRPSVVTEEVPDFRAFSMAITAWSATCSTSCPNSNASSEPSKGRP